MKTPEYTGEFVVPGQTPQETLDEHLARYLFAAEYATGRTVLDVASGTGYGAAMLAAAGARRVIGIEQSADVIDFARAQYRRPGLSFVQGDALNLPLAPDSVDLVVSFETIEHLSDHQRFVAECHRVLGPAGLFVCSSPNRRVYSLGLTRPINPFHAHEFTPGEFRRLLRRTFGGPVDMFAQRTMGLRARLAYELYHLEHRLPSPWRLGDLFRNWSAGDKLARGVPPNAEPMTGPDPRYRVEPFRSTLARPATFMVAVCRRRPWTSVTGGDPGPAQERARMIKS